MPDHYASRTRVAVAGALVAILLSTNAIGQRVFQYLESRSNSCDRETCVDDRADGNLEHFAQEKELDYSGIRAILRNSSEPYNTHARDVALRTNRRPPERYLQKRR